MQIQLSISNASLVLILNIYVNLISFSSISQDFFANQAAAWVPPVQPDDRHNVVDFDRDVGFYQGLLLEKIRRHCDVEMNFPSKLTDEKSDGSQDCAICLDNKRSILFLPCRHMITCSACTGKMLQPVQGNRVPKCPLCREVIREFIPVILN